MYAAVNARDRAAIRELTAPDIVVGTTVEAFRGPEALLEWLDDGDDAFDDFTVELLEVEELGGYVVASMRQRGRGKASGAEVDDRITHVWTLRDGRATELQSFAHRDDAVRYAQRRTRASRGESAAGMAERNVDIVRQVYECVNERRWDRMAELLDPDVAQYGTVGGLEEGTVVRGRSEITQMYESEADAWDRQRIEPQRLIDAGDRVVVFQREYQRGRSSGLELVVETAAVVDLRDGRVVRIQGYMDRAAALRAAGLSEQEVHSST
jgi:ketosteroid isomerase-like protein